MPQCILSHITMHLLLEWQCIVTFSDGWVHACARDLQDLTAENLPVEDLLVPGICQSLSRDSWGSEDQDIVWFAWSWGIWGIRPYFAGTNMDIPNRAGGSIYRPTDSTGKELVVKEDKAKKLPCGDCPTTTTGRCSVLSVLLGESAERVTLSIEYLACSVWCCSNYALTVDLGWICTHVWGVRLISPCIAATAPGGIGAARNQSRDTTGKKLLEKMWRICLVIIAKLDTQYNASSPQVAVWLFWMFWCSETSQRRLCP